MQTYGETCEEAIAFAVQLLESGDSLPQVRHAIESGFDLLPEDVVGIMEVAKEQAGC